MDMTLNILTDENTQILVYTYSSYVGTYVSAI